MIAHCPSLSRKMFMISASCAHRLIYRLSVIGDRGRSPSIRDGLRYRYHSLPCAQHAPNTAFRPFLCRRPAVRRKPLNPAMRRVCVAIRHSFSYPGLRPIRWPHTQIRHSAGVLRFWGSGAGKKDAKIIRCFWKLILAVFEQFSDDFFAAPGSKNIGKYSVFVLSAYRNYILQHGENCVNTSVFARHWPKKHVNTVILLPEANNIVNTVVLGFQSAKKHQYLQCFLLRECQKMRKHHLFDDF